jgi:hypothetical protein
MHGEPHPRRALAQAIGFAMDLTAPCPLAGVLAQRLRDEQENLTMRWLERISQRVNLHPNRIFPTEDMLDHVPILILGSPRTSRIRGSPSQPTHR